jgi:tetratricopeptide (TPR) repeat protein
MWRAKGDVERALADHSEAIRLDPKDGVFWNGRCWSRATAGRELDLALADCNEAVRLLPREAEILDNRGLVHLRLGRLGNAIADYDAALALAPKHASSLFGRGLAKLRQGDAAGQADIAAAKAAQVDIADEFAKWGIKPGAP